MSYSKLNPQDRTAVAYALYDAQFGCSWSTDLADNLIAGYGDFHKDGEFMYPLHVVQGEVLPWENVKRYLHSEEMMENAQDVFAGFSDMDVRAGDFIKYEGEFYRAVVDEDGRFAFQVSDGSGGLQTEEGDIYMPLTEWNDHFLFDKLFVYDQED